MSKTGVLAPLVAGMPSDDVAKAVKSYENAHTAFGGDKAARKAEYMNMVNNYYSLATDFYEYGWGTSFHFAHRYKGESHECSLKRHEHYLALKLSLKPEHQVLDVGCGVGGPLREVALFSGAQITGLNNNDYQIKKGTEYNRAVGQGLTERCGFLKADFMDIPKEANSYDAVYAIDATCHAPDAVKCYQEIFRVLKPGCMFAGYEWCSTDLNDPSNPKHKAILDEIELGNGLPDIRSTEQVKAALLAAGFIIKETVDLANSADVPWYEPIDPSRFSLTAFRTTRLGRMLTRNLVCALEKTGFAPQGSGRVAAFLERAGDGLVAGGKEGIFTPLYFFLVQKPE